jgi:hypothetical protein
VPDGVALLVVEIGVVVALFFAVMVVSPGWTALAVAVKLGI